ncbi:hypothetical protein EDB81DRAFT_910601 [Dactylonectria macrodidyma]|uniref:Uncharacterized protein n=1 Tax=Dactylonectria macrodidyma TaxID=307937 RepID=A0A9P9DV26_9HYPO|nr:hypothetical protein EDB81DRAFT_910601 [Dactylonectria macrodidyma]
MEPQPTWPNSLSIPVDNLFTKEEVESVAYWPGRSKLVTVTMLGILSSEMLRIAERLTERDEGPFPYTYDPSQEERPPIRAFCFEPGPAVVFLQCSQAAPPFEYPLLTRQHVEDADVSMYVFSVTDRESFLSLCNSFTKFAVPLEGQKQKIKFVIAAQTDAPREKWAVSLWEAEQFSQRIGADLLAVSSKTAAGCGIKEGRNLAIRVRLRQIEAAEEKMRDEKLAAESPSVANRTANVGTVTRVVDRWRRVIHYNC